MKRQLLQHVLMSATIAIAGSIVHANPVAGQFTNDPRGDAIGDLMLTHEIGDAQLFPVGDAILYHDHRAFGHIGQ